MEKLLGNCKFTHTSLQPRAGSLWMSLQFAYSHFSPEDLPLVWQHCTINWDLQELRAELTAGPFHMPLTSLCIFFSPPYFPTQHPYQHCHLPLATLLLKSAQFLRAAMANPLMQTRISSLQHLPLCQSRHAATRVRRDNGQTSPGHATTFPKQKKMQHAVLSLKETARAPKRVCVCTLQRC